MAYCTQNDILDQISETELIELTDDSDTGVIDTDIVDRAVDDADSEIDGYCNVRYTVPFSAENGGVPNLIRKFSVDIAIYNLFARRHRVELDRKERYDNAVDYLKDVSKGVATLGTDAVLSDADGGPKASTNILDRIFTRGRLSRGSSGTLDNY